MHTPSAGLALLLFAAGCRPSAADAPAGVPSGGPAEGSGAAAADPLAPDSLIGTFEGHFSAGFEHTGFRPCADTTETWWTEPAAEMIPIGRDQYRMEMDPAADVLGAYVALTGYDGVAVNGPVVLSLIHI